MTWNSIYFFVFLFLFIRNAECFFIMSLSAYTSSYIIELFFLVVSLQTDCYLLLSYVFLKYSVYLSFIEWRVFKYFPLISKVSLLLIISNAK